MLLNVYIAAMVWNCSGAAAQDLPARCRSSCVVNVHGPRDLFAVCVARSQLLSKYRTIGYQLITHLSTSVGVRARQTNLHPFNSLNSGIPLCEASCVCLWQQLHRNYLVLGASENYPPPPPPAACSAYCSSSSCASFCSSSS